MSDLIALNRGEMERQEEVWNYPGGGERRLGAGLVTGWGQGPAARNTGLTLMKSTQDNHTPSLSLGVLLCGRTGIQRASLVSGGKESTCNTGSAGDSDSIPGSERSPGRRVNPLQYSGLENPMDRGV